MTAIVDELCNSGHEVYVVTSLPWYRHHQVEPRWRGSLINTRPSSQDSRRTEVRSTSITKQVFERLLSVKPRQAGKEKKRIIIRVHPFPTSKTSIFARAIGFVGFSVLATSVAVKPSVKPDVVLVMSPPLTLGLAGWLAARRWRVPLVLNVQDVYPDAMIQLGVIRNRWLIGLARQFERFTYRCCDAITVLSDEMKENLDSKLNSSWHTRLQVIPNFVDTKRIHPLARTTRYRARYGLGDRTVVMYAGNIGFSQPLNLMLDAAHAFRHHKDVVFVINGMGSALEALKSGAVGLNNVVFTDFQPEQHLNDVLASADVHVIVLKKGLAHSSVPSKLYSILAAGRPVVVSLDAETEVSQVVKRANSGLAVPPEDSQAFIAAIRQLIDDPVLRQELGQNGRAFVKSWVSVDMIAQAYLKLFAELANTR